MKNKIFFFLAAFLLINVTNQAHADAMDDVERGSLLLRGEQSQLNQAFWQTALEMQTDVEIEINGLIASVTVKHNFKNPTDSWMEGIYVFPLPDDSAVNGMQMELDGRLIVGEIKEKQQAKQIYQKAKREGKRAALLSQSRPNIFTSKVANIPPQGEIGVEIRYQQSVRLDNGVFELRFPLVIGPRFNASQTVTTSSHLLSSGGSGFRTDGVMTLNDITEDANAPKVSITVELTPGFDLQEVKSLYHPVNQLFDNRKVKLNLQQKEVVANRDFVLNWRAAPNENIQLAHFSETLVGEDFHKVLIMPPQVEADQMHTLSRELMFVVDTSGSMSGMSMTQAKKALIDSLARLTPEDQFNIIEFDNEYTKFSPMALPATVANRARATRWINQLDADGGTNMFPALQQALQSVNSNNRLVKQVVFITDGAVNNEQQLFKLIDQTLGQARLFTIGIGSAPNSFFMSRAAKAGRGSYTFIGKPEEVETKLSALFDKMSRPAFTRFTVDASNGLTAELYPDPIPDLYYGEPLVLHDKTNGANGALTFKADNGQQAWQHRLMINGVSHSATGQGGDQGVASLWARQKIESLLESKMRGVSEEQVRQQVLPVALKHQLVSPYTSFVAVEKKVSRPDKEKLKSQKLKQAMPHGWSKEKVFGYPQTNLGTRGLFMMGWLFLIVAVSWMLISQRRKTSC